MKISKITKTFSLALLALAFCTPMTMAAGDESPNASTAFSVTLPEYLKITVNAPTFAKTVSYDNNYAGANIEAMNPQFTVITNDPAKDIYLQAKCTATDGAPNALFSLAGEGGVYSADKLYIALANEGRATTAAVGKAMSATASDTPDVIRLSLTPTLNNDNFGASAITAEWDVAKSQVHYVLKNGTNTLSYATGVKIEANSFSTHDTHGIYKATLTMTNTSL